MYSIALERISLDEFKTMMTTMNVLPGRRILLNDLPGVIDRLKHKNINQLEALRKLLSDKKRYPELADALMVSQEYLAVLNREINSYVPRPVLLSKLDVFSVSNLKSLEDAGLKSTQDLYRLCLTQAAREDLSNRLHIPEEIIYEALELADLLRVNGIGPVYAKILREIGIRNTSDYLKTGPKEILDRFWRINEEKKYTKTKLGLNDVEYCKRFCTKLDMDIEW